MARYDYRCGRCLTIREIVHPMRAHPVVRCDRGHQMRRTLSEFATSKDQRYLFVTQHVKPGTEIRSAGQWRRFLKTHHLTDDVSPKEQLDRLACGYADKKRQERSRAFRDQITRVLMRAG